MRSKVVLISSCIVLALALGAAFFAGSPSHIQAAGTIYYVDAEAIGAATGVTVQNNPRTYGMM